MKLKIFLGLILLTSLVVTAGFVVKSYELDNHFDYQETYSDNFYRQGHCQGRYYQTYSYEALYNHLSADDQETVNLLYLEKLSEYDLDILTETERLEVISQVKAEMIDYIIENFEYVGW